jgi:hypothetical protein
MMVPFMPLPFFMLIFYNCATACGTIIVFIDPIDTNHQKTMVFTPHRITFQTKLLIRTPPPG